MSLKYKYKCPVVQNQIQTLSYNRILDWTKLKHLHMKNKMHSYDFHHQYGGKHCGKKEKMPVTSFLSFSHNVFNRLFLRFVMNLFCCLQMLSIWTSLKFSSHCVELSHYLIPRIQKTTSGFVFSNHSQEHSLSSSPWKFESNTTSDWLNYKFWKIWRTRFRLLLRMVGKYRPWSLCKEIHENFNTCTNQWVRAILL